MRIIAGSAKGRRLEAPKGSGTRPTSDRTKESLFNMLGQWCEGEEVLDLYAGLGGLGLEALSRGARHATLVESARPALEALKANIRALGFQASTTVVPRPVERALEGFRKESRAFTLVFSDPPYALRAGAAVLEALEAGLLSPGGRAVIEHDRREILPETLGSLTRSDERRFGDTVLSFYVRAPESGLG